MSKETDYLTEDPIITNQRYVCLSFLMPNEEDKKSGLSVKGLKVRGSFDSYEEAKKRAAFLQNIDKIHNIYIAEVGKWCPFDDDPEKAEDGEYMNKELNKLMKSYHENQKKAAEYHEIRKQDLINKALDEVNKKKDTKEVKHKKTSKINKLEEKMDDIKNTMDDQIEKLNESREDINENINRLRELEAELCEKMKEMDK
jgi:hypothetical protein